MIFPNGEIINGDALQVMAEMADDSVDMVFTDPPYKTVSGGVTSQAGRKYGWDASSLHKNDGKIFKHNNIKPSDYLPELSRVLKPGGHCYIMTNRITLRALLNAAHDNKFHLTNMLFWGKGRKNANRFYMMETEMVCMFYNKPAIKINDCGQSQIYFCPPVYSGDKTHPTEKPVRLVQHYIEQSTKSGDIIFDPFAGTASTALAAIRSGRRFKAVELDEAYYLKACGRLWSETQTPDEPTQIYKSSTKNDWTLR